CRLDPTLGGRTVLGDPVANLVRQVEARTILLDLLDDPDALVVMSEALGREEPAEQLLPDVPERGMPDVVAHGHGLDEIFIQAERTCHRAADLRDLERVRQTRAVVVADGREEHLRLVLEPAERLAMHYPVAIEGERRARRGRLLRAIAARARGAGRVLGKRGRLELLGVLAHAQP